MADRDDATKQNDGTYKTNRTSHGNDSQIGAPASRDSAAQFKTPAHHPIEVSWHQAQEDTELALDSTENGIYAPIGNHTQLEIILKATREDYVWGYKTEFGGRLQGM